MSFWSNKRIVVTGGAGFLGSYVVKRLRQHDCEVLVPRKQEYDLTFLEAALQYFEETKPDIVIHSAAYYGGIWINQLYPGKIYYENLVMGANVMEAARRVGVQKFVGIGTAYSYPGNLKGFLSEEDLWQGLPHESVVNYGTTKKMLIIQGLAYRKQYDFNAIHVILTNLYGPGDTFNPERSHVVAALIRKFVEAKQNVADAVEVWGSGKPIREFLYVDDAAKAILLAAEKYDQIEPMNIGTGVGTSINELAETIQQITEFDGPINWNTEKPDGQLRKVLDITRMKNALAWTPETSWQEN